MSKINNFSTLRLVFASAVIFSHSPFILTGDTSREPHIGRETLGGLAVDGFFLVSGYLIAKSFDQDGNLLDFFRKRILRIYPAFLVNMLLLLFVVAPFVTQKYHPSPLWLPRLLFLGGAPIDGAFSGMPVVDLNGSVWTLSHEFRCYIMVSVLGATFGLRNIRGVILVAALVLLALSPLPLPSSSGALYILFGFPASIARLFGMFAVGMSFYLWRDRIVYNHNVAIVVMIALAASIGLPFVSNLAIAIFGGYLVFWVTFAFPSFWLSRFGNKTDLSYGIYLYAWPIQMLIAYEFGLNINPWCLSWMALIASATAAYLSWTLIEKPAIAYAKRVALPVVAAAG